MDNSALYQSKLTTPEDAVTIDLLRHYYLDGHGKVRAVGLLELSCRVQVANSWYGTRSRLPRIVETLRQTGTPIADEDLAHVPHSSIVT